jgi:hypothetical protein
MASDFYNSSGSVWPKITGHEQHAHTLFRKSIIVLANPILQRLGPKLKRGCLAAVASVPWNMGR